MLPYAEWLEAAQALPLNRSRRVQHCNHNTTMKISHDDTGFHAYCFRCAESGFKAHGERRIADLFPANEEFCHAKSISLPVDFDKEVPDEAAVWFLKSGVSKSLAESYGIGYSAKLRRVILPVYNGDELAVVQARAVFKGMKPKYLNQIGNKKSTVLFKSHSARHLTGCSVAICEDILSTIRVGEIMPAVCPMGTSLSDAQAGQLLAYSKVLIWLDPDAAGIKGSVKMHRKLAPVVPACIIRADADPKCYDNIAIKEILDGY